MNRRSSFREAPVVAEIAGDDPAAIAGGLGNAQVECHRRLNPLATESIDKRKPVEQRGRIEEYRADPSDRLKDLGVSPLEVVVVPDRFVVEDPVAEKADAIVTFRDPFTALNMSWSVREAVTQHLVVVRTSPEPCVVGTVQQARPKPKPQVRHEFADGSGPRNLGAAQLPLRVIKRFLLVRLQGESCSIIEPKLLPEVVAGIHVDGVPQCDGQRLQCWIERFAECRVPEVVHRHIQVGTTAAVRLQPHGVDRPPAVRIPHGAAN